MCLNSALLAVLALPSCNVGLQYYSLHFTRTAIKTTMVHSTPPRNFVNRFTHDTNFKQHSGALCSRLNILNKFSPRCTHFPPSFRIDVILLSIFCGARVHIGSLVYIFSLRHLTRHISYTFSSSKERYNCRGLGGGICTRFTVYEGCLFAQSTAFEVQSNRFRENGTERRTSSTLGRMAEEDLFQLCTTSFMASFVQMKA